MKATKTACVRGCCAAIFCLLIACAMSRADSGATTRPTGEPIAQLASGKEAGTFHLVYHARAKFTMPGRCALQVSLTALPHRELIPLRLDGAGDFTLEADVSPGTYNVTVAPQDSNGDYWPSDWQRLHVSKDGGLYRPRGWLTQSLDFVLDRRMKDISPASSAIADGRYIPPSVPFSALERPYSGPPAGLGTVDSRIEIRLGRLWRRKLSRRSRKSGSENGDVLGTIWHRCLSWSSSRSRPEPRMDYFSLRDDAVNAKKVHALSFGSGSKRRRHDLEMK